MDDATIEQLLCKHCQPRFRAAVEAMRAIAKAKEAKTQLTALGIDLGAGGKMKRSSKKDDDDEPAPDMEEAFESTKRALVGNQWRKQPNPNEKHFPREQLLACIRGEISPGALTKKLKTSQATLGKNINAIIGPADGRTPWKPGVGHMRGGVRAIEMLARKDRQIAVDAVKGERHTDRRSGAPPKNGEGRRGIKVSDKDLARVVNKRVKAAAIARKYKISANNVYLQCSRFRERFGVPSPKALKEQESTETHSERASNGAASMSAPDDSFVQQVLAKAD